MKPPKFKTLNHVSFPVKQDAGTWQSEHKTHSNTKIANAGYKRTNERALSMNVSGQTGSNSSLVSHLNRIVCTKKLPTSKVSNTSASIANTSPLSCCWTANRYILIVENVTDSSFISLQNQKGPQLRRSLWDKWDQTLCNEMIKH